MFETIICSSIKMNESHDIPSKMYAKDLRWYEGVKVKGTFRDVKAK